MSTFLQELSIKQLRGLKWGLEHLIERFPEDEMVPHWYSRLEEIKEERAHRRRVRKIKKFFRETGLQSA